MLIGGGRAAFASGGGASVLSGRDAYRSAGGMSSMGGGQSVASGPMSTVGDTVMTDLGIAGPSASEYEGDPIPFHKAIPYARRCSARCRHTLCLRGCARAVRSVSPHDEQTTEDSYMAQALSVVTLLGIADRVTLWDLRMRRVRPARAPVRVAARVADACAHLLQWTQEMLQRVVRNIELIDSKMDEWQLSEFKVRACVRERTLPSHANR
jgi:hypothetical protein